MNSLNIKKEGNIAIVEYGDILINTVNDALDLIATIGYELKCYKVVLSKDNICEEFFDLKTNLAGEILQKFINYSTKIAIVGDFSKYTSKSLKDFIYECNLGKDIFFVLNIETAITKLNSVN